MNKRILLTTLLGGTLLAGATVLAQPSASDGPAEFKPTRFKQAPHRPHPRMRLMRMAWVLDLSPEQKEQMRQLLQEQRDQFRQLRQQQRETRLAIMALQKSDRADEKALNALLDQATELYRQKLELRMHAREALEAILTEDQREQWQQWQLQHRPRRQG